MVKVPSLVALTVLDFVHVHAFGCEISIVGAVVSTITVELTSVASFEFHAASDTAQAFRVNVVEPAD